ncbi:MAG: GC-type dockerin domain-anchored protein [Phycisphaerales bacterium JB052]
MNKFTTITALLLASTIAQADTTQNGPSNYTIDEGVSFSLGNLGPNDWLFSWSDSSGTFTEVADPTITLTAGQTYIFDNLTTIHPFVITDDTLVVNGTDGDFSRETFDGPVIDAATLQPMADFTADPEPADDVISWTPSDSDAGEYWYTCRIAGHAGMTGKLVIVEAPASCPADLTGEGELNFFDVSAFLAAFAAGDPAADFTGDGMYNFFDVSAFLGAFAAGCP